MARANRLSEQVPLKVALKEVMPTKFLPFARHVTDDVVMLDSGAIMLTFELQGRAFETADVRDLNDWHAKLNGMLRNLHDDRLSIWTHLVRARVEQYPGGNFRSRFARELDAAYFARMNKERSASVSGAGEPATACGAAGSGSSSGVDAVTALAWAATVPTPPRVV